MIKEKDTLVVLTPGFPANEADTTCLPFLQGHLTAIKRVYPQLEIIVLAFQYPYVKGAYIWHNITVISFDGREKARLNRLRIWWQVWKTLTQLNKKKRIVGMLSLWCTECALIGHYFAGRHNLKHYTWLCGQDAKAGNKYVRLIKPKSNELIAMSDFLKREFYKNYAVMPAHVIPLGIDPAQFPAHSTAKDIDVLGAGSLIQLKQYDVFVEVINKLKDQLPAIRSTICGKGNEEHRLKSMICSHQIGNNLELAGEVSHDNVLRLMQRTKIFLHTSNYEGLGTVCIEALYAGAHVVSFTRPLDQHIVHWHHVNNIEEMTDKVLSLLQDAGTSYTRICPFYADDIASSMMSRFGY